MTYTLESKFGELLDNAAAKDILEKHSPGITTHPMVGFVRGMTLRALLDIPQLAQYQITTEKVESVLKEINAAVK